MTVTNGQTKKRSKTQAEVRDETEKDEQPDADSMKKKRRVPPNGRSSSAPLTERRVVPMKPKVTSGDLVPIACETRISCLNTARRQQLAHHITDETTRDLGEGTNLTDEGDE